MLAPLLHSLERAREPATAAAGKMRLRRPHPHPPDPPTLPTNRAPLLRRAVLGGKTPLQEEDELVGGWSGGACCVRCAPMTDAGPAARRCSHTARCAAAVPCWLPPSTPRFTSSPHSLNRPQAQHIYQPRLEALPGAAAALEAAAAALPMGQAARAGRRAARKALSVENPMNEFEAMLAEEGALLRGV